MARSRTPGYVRQRGDTWQVIVELEPDPLTGKRRRIFRTAPTEKAAERLRAKLVTEAAEGTAQAPEKRTVAELSEAWLRHIAPNRSPSTMIGYRAKLDRYILPAIGKVRLDRLRPIQLDGLYATLRESGGEDGKALSAQTVRHVHAICHAMLAQARRWGWITKNPAEDATPPAPDTVEPKPPTPDEVARLHAGALADPPDYELAMLIWIAAVVGPRRGEVCGLRWSDLDGNALVIERSIVVAGGGDLRVKSTKTRKARRVSLDAYTVGLLEEHRKRAEVRAEVCDDDVLPDGYILSEAPDCAEPIHPDVLSKRFQRLADKLGIDCHLHLLRHAHISWALAAGVPVLDVSRGAGHSSGRMTMDRYGHVVGQSSLTAEVIVEGLRAPRGK